MIAPAPALAELPPLPPVPPVAPSSSPLESSSLPRMLQAATEKRSVLAPA
jgi:hypothetical protein